jgi:putative transposase
MRRNRLALFLHLVWATWDRLPMIDQASERPLYREIENEAIGMRCTVLALNGTADHVHVVLILPSTVTVADLAKQLKGSSSHFFNEVLQPEMPFKWQGSYGAFTVSRWDVDRIVAYVKNQKQHHADATVLPEWEETYEDVAPSAGSAPPRDPRRETPNRIRD